MSNSNRVILRLQGSAVFSRSKREISLSSAYGLAWNFGIFLLYIAGSNCSAIDHKRERGLGICPNAKSDYSEYVYQGLKTF